MFAIPANKPLLRRDFSAGSLEAWPETPCSRGLVAGVHGAGSIRPVSCRRRGSRLLCSSPGSGRPCWGPVGQEWPPIHLQPAAAPASKVRLATVAAR